MQEPPMDRKTASDFPQELLNSFDHYVHGEISRRQFLGDAAKYAAGGLTAMAIWESLRPNYALAQQVPQDDKRLKTEFATVPSPQGNGSIRGYFVRPAKAPRKLPGVLVIHENRGLNPYIEDVARRLGTENFIAFAPDGLTSVGGYPGDDEKGGAAFQKVDRVKMTEDFVAAARWLKARPDCTGKIGVVGFCYGGGGAASPGEGGCGGVAAGGGGPPPGGGGGGPRSGGGGGFLRAPPPPPTMSRRSRPPSWFTTAPWTLGSPGLGPPMRPPSRPTT